MSVLNLSTVICALSMLGTGASVGMLNNTAMHALEPEVTGQSTGTIEHVSPETDWFELRNDTEIVKLNVDDDTVYQLDGSSSTAAETLKVGYEATVQYEKGVATRVEATTPDEDSTT